MLVWVSGVWTEEKILWTLSDTFLQSNWVTFRNCCAHCNSHLITDSVLDKEVSFKVLTATFQVLLTQSLDELYLF